jgi:serine protease inhibitor
MKKILSSTILLFILLIQTSNIKSQTVYATINSGFWSDVAVWETYSSFANALAATPGSGTAATTVPSGTHNVVIRNGHTIAMNGANRGCKGIIINSGGKLWANEATERRLQIGAGGTGFAYPLVDTVQVDGVVGGPGDGCYFEVGVNAQLVKIWGTGSIDIARFRCPGNIGSSGGGVMSIDVDINMNIWKSANYALSLVYNPNANDNYTFNIKPGRTVATKSADGYFHNSQNTASYGRYNYNIQGTLDLTANTQTTNNTSANLIAPAGAASAVTINVDGGLFKAGAAMRMDTSTTGPISSGILDFNVINGGVVDLTLTTSLRVGRTTNGAGGVNSMFFGTDGTGRIKTNAGTALIPIGINTGTTSNNCRIINTGTADVYSVGLKSTFDNPPANPSIVVNKQWYISELVAGGSNDTLKLSWVTADQASSFDPAQPIAIMQWSGSAWVNNVATISGTGTSDDPYVATTAGIVSYNSPYFGLTNTASVNPAPTVSAFTPNAVCSTIGGTITITGTNFTGATAVNIGGTAATSYTVVSATQITAVVGAGVSGIVSVTTATGTASSSTSLSLTTPTTPTFTQVAAICAGGSFTLPTTSNNAISGTWVPAINNAATTTYTFTPTAGQCATTATMTVTVNAATTPTFTQVAAICAGGSFTLPTTSNNAISGTWSPTINNAATTTYTFTPTTGQCATTATMTVTVNAATTPTFTQVAAICVGGSFTLPTTSNNAIIGSWSPAINNTATTTYTFTPTTGQCATTATMTVTVNTGSVVPTFTQVATICAGGSFSLPTTSTNAITGTWSPAINNTATTTYTFTPTAGQCATTATMTVSVNASTTPTFTQVAAICAGGSFTLPTTSNNAITGTWSPAINNVATTTYTFTPTTGQCATTATLTVTVNPATTPTFTQVAAICVGGSFTLPTTSNNAITGAWAPAINNAATTTYTFTPTTGQCATTATMTVTVNASTTPTFTQVATICVGGSFTLPTTSNNAINGTWSPAINNAATTTYTFTPTTGQCATTATMTVTVNASTTPTFTQVAAICAGGSFTLPTTSNNAITGTWSPAINNAATTTYTFTPTAGQCATTATMTVTVNASTTPTFTQITAICAGGSITLPTSSNNAINGTWAPAINNQATTTYTFTPAAGQCATIATMTVNVNAATTPTFTQVAPIIAGGSFTLPTTSTNGITGTWSPAIDNQNTTMYTFTPAAGQCATTAIMTVTVNPAPTTNAVVYSNPTTDGVVTINWSNANIQNNRIVTITVIDRLGRIVSRIDNLSSGSGISTNVDLGLKKYSDGLYIVKIVTADNSVVYSTKIVKSRRN